MKMENVFRKIVVITGILNFPIGLMMMLPALMSPNPETLVTSVVVGAFLMFAGAALVWASKDIEHRASIIVWNGIVRLIGVTTVSYLGSMATIPTEQIVISAMDFALFLIYSIGCVKITGKSFVTLLLGKI